MMRNGFYGFDNFCGSMGWGRGIFMMIGGLLLLGLFVYFLVTLTRNNKTSQTIENNVSHPSTGNALTILSERYARGEINDEEYERKKTELRK